MNELNKVQAKLSEAEIILTERGTYLRELKKERDMTKNEILNLIQGSSENQNNLYSIKRLNHFLDRPIYYGGWYPDYNTRLYYKNSAKWTNPKVHEKLIPIETKKTDKNNRVIKLNSNLNHYTFHSLGQQVQTNLKSDVIVFLLHHSYSLLQHQALH